MRKPAHREGYAHLDIRKLPGEARWRREVCRFTNETGREVGQAAVVQRTADDVDIMYGLVGGHFEGSGIVRLTVEQSPDPVNPLRQFFRCPTCGRRKKIIYLKRSPVEPESGLPRDSYWACADCHQLKFRIQLLRRDVTRYERNQARRDELHAKLKDGRPLRMREATFDREQRELAQLNRWLKKARPRVASADHRHRVRGEWLPVEELPNGLFFDALLLQGGELVRQDWFNLPPAFRRSDG